MTEKKTNPSSKPGPWHVRDERFLDDDGNPTEYEISVIHRKFAHGHKSAGWGGPNKIILAEAESADCSAEDLVEVARRAQIIADAYNAANVPFTKE